LSKHELYGFFPGRRNRGTNTWRQPFFSRILLSEIAKTITLKGIGTGMWQTRLLISSGILGVSYTILLKLSAISDDKMSEKGGWRQEFVPLFRSHDEEP